MPATINEAKDLLPSIDQEAMTASECEGYFFDETTSAYGEVEQRWLVVLYEPRRTAELASFEKCIQRKPGQSSEETPTEAFNCAEDAHKALEHFNKKYQYHMITAAVTSNERYAQHGRPTDTSETVTDWHLTLMISTNEVTVAQAQSHLASTSLPPTCWMNKRYPQRNCSPSTKTRTAQLNAGFAS